MGLESEWCSHSQYELTEATADAMQKQIDHVAESDKKVSISCGQENDVIFRKAAIEALARMMPRSYTPDGSHPADEEIFRVQEIFADCIEALEILPSAQPATNCSEIPNGSDDTISRRAAIDALWKALYEYEDETEKQFQESEDLDVEDWIGHRIFVQNMNDIDRQTILNLPSAQPEIIHCGECIYYDPPHVEKEDARYEYSEMPKEAFDVLGTGLVSMEYGINIGGRCCVDYYCKSYSDDKRVYVRENNYCGRAERRTE